ncbi:HD domain-containing protein [Petrocella sp. FN5]|uniref:HD domain-containing protein n=1 Tax=Petrocella sp. FN5 TaxID=3032002 RepID=UPI0023DAF342|nr:HD domain-containing protein [Petrocella sp. FN5]MDF1617081.1 HD domain-containing protein [Petrocella sp. FN5]
MKKIQRIYENKDYQYYLREIEKMEVNRVYCKHDMAHFLDVARIAWIMCLENEIKYNKTWVYACGLLHDIGRGCQYATGEPHEVAGARLAKGILEASGFEGNEIEFILKAIANHKNKAIANQQNLDGILYRADKASRACYTCESIELCNWSMNKKNLKIEV